MKSYFYLQAKLTAKYLPFVLAVTLLLALGMGFVLSGVLSVIENDGSRKTHTVAITGDTDDEYLKWGIAALDSINEERFSVRIVEMEQTQAHTALQLGQISAYAVIPEGFMEKAHYGEVEAVTYVTAAGMEGADALLKREITRLVTNMVVYSQKGAYGLLDALTEYKVKDDPYTHMTVLCLEYTDMILHRDEISEVSELGISDGLSIREYYVCAGLVLLLSMMGIPFAPLYIKRDHALSQLLASRRISHGKQLLCEYCGHLLGMLAVGVVILLGFWHNSDLVLMEFTLDAIPVVLMLTAMNMLLFHLAGNLISGLLLHFFGAVVLCYCSGCIYPVTAFPVSVQKLAMWLPNGIARQHLAACFVGAPRWNTLVGLFGYCVVFLCLALLVRCCKRARFVR